MHTCSRCDTTFTNLRNLIHHICTVHAAAGGFTCQECNYRTTRKDIFHRHVKSKHGDVKASAANRAPVPNIIDPENDISAQDIELMELTHDVAFSQYSDLLQISDDEQPPIKKSAKSKISKDTFSCTDCELMMNSHQSKSLPNQKYRRTLSAVQIVRCRPVRNLN